jgi:5-methylcytosine-specific restriction endonuclease McrA
MISQKTIHTKEDGLDELVIRLTDNYKKILDLTTLKENNLWWGGNGVGNRWANSKFNYGAILSKTVKNYSENEDDVVPEDILKKFREENTGCRGIFGIYVFSKRKNIESHPIRVDISNVIKKMSCVSCGSNSDIVCDHKNDLYNDPRVLDTKTQQLDDFQALCNHCNLQKRQVCKRERETGLLYSAKQIPKFAIYDFDFVWEKKKLDLTDKDCKKGTYWYDPVEFSKNIYRYLKELK